MKNRYLIWPALASLLCGNVASWAAQDAKAAPDYLRASAKDMEWWREAKFGLFIHWGPVSLKGTEIGWSRGGERRGQGGTGEIPAAEYDNLFRQFNPTRFKASNWVATAKAAGMKYLVFTSKHHDGFCMFDTKLTDHKITNPSSPYRRDVVAALARAAHIGGVKLGFYYSPVDWHHPDYRTTNHARYIEYLHGQARELCQNYGKLDLLWWDSLGGSAKDWDSENLFRMIRQSRPHIIINNRAGLAADYDTPEQEIGKFKTDRPWESCMTICQQWAWKPNDRLKSLQECLDILVRTVGGDGNLLLNVGPMPTGEIEPRQVERLKEIGQWLRRYGKSIYGSRGGPFKPASWGASTHKGNTIYVHVLNWNGQDKITLPVIEKKITKSTLLTGGKVAVAQTPQGIEIRVPAEYRQPIDTIVALKLEGPASEISPR